MSLAKVATKVQNSLGNSGVDPIEIGNVKTKFIASENKNVNAHIML